MEDLEFDFALKYFEMVLSLQELSEKQDRWLETIPDDIHPCTGCYGSDKFPEYCRGCADFDVHPKKFHPSRWL